MSRFLPYLLLALVALQGGGYLLLPAAQVAEARAQAMQRIGEDDEASVETFVVGRHEFEQGRSGRREWWHGGQLYDLKTVDMRGDSVRLTALPDAAEQHLLAGMQRLFSLRTGSPSAPHPFSCLLIQLLAQPFLPPYADWALTPTALASPRSNFFFEMPATGEATPVFSPPPELG